MILRKKTTKRKSATMKNKLSTIISTGLLVMTNITSAQAELTQKPALTLSVAKKMADGCEELARKKGWKMNIAIVDEGANLMLFRRMSGSILKSGEIALDKAKTSAGVQVPTRMIEQMAFGSEGHKGPVPGIANVDGIIAFAGGLPISASRFVIGGVGVSGGTADEDEQCAQAGLSAVAQELK